MFSLDSPFNSFGLDISDYSLKLAQVKRKGSKLELSLFAQMDLPAGIIIDGKISDFEAFRSKISELMNSVKSKGLSPYVVTSLPEKITYIKLLTLPQVKSDELAKSLEAEIIKHFPYELNEIEMDYQILSEFSGQNFDQMQALVGVAPKDIVNQYLSALVSASLRPVAFEIEAQAIARAIIPINFDISEGLGIMDIGASRSSFIIFDRGVLNMSVSIPISGRQISEELAKRVQIPIQEAEELKRKCGLDDSKCQGVIKEVLLGSTKALVDKIKTSIDFYYENFPSATPIKRIFLCGGGSNTINIDKMLSEELNLKVQRADTLINIDGKSALKFINIQNALGSATVLGLALREHLSIL